MQLNFGLLSSTYQRSLTCACFWHYGPQAAIKEYNHVRINPKFLFTQSINSMTVLYVSTLPLVNFNFGLKWTPKSQGLVEYRV